MTYNVIIHVCSKFPPVQICVTLNLPDEASEISPRPCFYILKRDKCFIQNLGFFLFVNFLHTLFIVHLL